MTATPSDQDKPFWLAIIRCHLDGLDDPNHWSLFVLREDKREGLGWEYEIKDKRGYMRYKSAAEAINLPRPESPRNPWSMYVVRSLTEEQAATVREVADREQPVFDQPSANENSQCWVAKVVLELVKRGIVNHKSLVTVKSMMFTRAAAGPNGVKDLPSGAS